MDVPPPPPIVSGDDAEAVNPLVEGVRASHDAMQWAYADKRRALEAKKVALVVDSSGDGITPRWVFLDAIGEGRGKRALRLTHGGGAHRVLRSAPRQRRAA